jgi:hypothetical protein
VKELLLLGGLLACFVALVARGGGDGSRFDLDPGSSVMSSSLGQPSPPPLPAVPGSTAGSALPVEYKIAARLDPKEHKLSGSLELRWRNPSQQAAERLPFHLYLNAFAHTGTRILGESWRSGQRDGGGRAGGWGWIEVRDVKVDGVGAKEVSLEDDGTVMKVQPVSAIASQQTALVTMDFEARLPKVRLRTGYAGDFHLVGQWFPKLGRREPDGAWHCEPFHPNGEFYADFGSYDVTLEVPERFDVAATGLRSGEKKLAGGWRRFSYMAAPVHDFAWVAAPGLKRKRGHLGRIVLEVVHTGESEAAVGRHLEHMRKALDRLGRWFAPYPYPLLTAVLVPAEAMAAGGMEYPTFFTSSAEHFPFLERLEALGTTVHELTHQYFQGMLASNEVEAPWLDEGLTTYVAGLLMDDIHGADRSAFEVGPFRLGYFALSRIWFRGMPGRDAASRRVPEFCSRHSYFANVYGKASLALRTLEGRIGRPRMLVLLKDYVTRYLFKHPSSADFFGVLDEHVKEPALRRFFHQAITTDGVLDYAVDAVRALSLEGLRGRFEHPDAKERRDARAALMGQGAKYLNRVLLVRKGELRLPVSVTLRFADGSREERAWDGEGRWHWLEVPNRHPIVSAEIDPEGPAALERSHLDNGRYASPSARPARRISGRLLVGLQIVLQSVGL